MEVHEGTATKDSKSEVMFIAAPEHMYTNPVTYDRDELFLSDVIVGDGRFIPVVLLFKYLGSILTSDCRDSADVDARIKSASAAFGSLRRCVFSAHDVWTKVKQHVYCPRPGVSQSGVMIGSVAFMLSV